MSVDCDDVIVTPTMYSAILSCFEYAPFILRRFEEDCFYIDMNALPKSNYLPIKGDYVAGLFFCNILKTTTKKLVMVKCERILA